MTQLDVTLLAGTERVATTFQDATGHSIIGTVGTNPTIEALMKDTGKATWAWAGTESILQKSYLVAYRSITDVDNVAIGSLMVGHDKNQLEAQIEDSIQVTFLTVTILILLSLLPIAMLSRTLSRSLKV